ncbi:PEGA domain-containing protein [Candidatus Gottesmanbacteria bacterium]|nr:PEGA domain-containing protein [Candidatus Gottesmanbacteria bacterium]
MKIYREFVLILPFPWYNYNHSMVKRILYSILVVTGLCLVTAGVISYGRGYRFDFKQKTISPTGILSVASYPEGASILVDGKLLSASNASLSLDPNWYDVKVEKTGYQSWNKRVKIQGEVVTKVDALLLPTSPSLRALTVTGVTSPTLSPSTTRLAYIVPEEESTSSANLPPRRGVWIMDLRNSALGGNPQPRQVYLSPEGLDLSGGEILWSPDEKQLLFLVKKLSGQKETVISALQISLDGGSIPVEVGRIYPTIISQWETMRKEQEDILLTGIPITVAQTLKNGASTIHFSPDETKIFYQATGSATIERVIDPPLIGSNSTEETRTLTPKNYYIYDVKEEKNFALTDGKSFPNPSSLFWYTDSKHIVMIEKDTISIIDYDGLNKRAVFQGSFENGYVFPWSSGGKLVILTRLTKSSPFPTLYEIDLR